MQITATDPYWTVIQSQLPLCHPHHYRQIPQNTTHTARTRRHTRHKPVISESTPRDTRNTRHRTSSTHARPHLPPHAPTILPICRQSTRTGVSPSQDARFASRPRSCTRCTGTLHAWTYPTDLLRKRRGPGFCRGKSFEKAGRHKPLPQLAQWRPSNQS